MAKAKSNNGLVGLDLTRDRIRIAALKTSGAGADPPQARRIGFEEVPLPDYDPRMPNVLPPAATLAPLLKTALARQGIGAGRAAVALGGSRMVLRYFIGSDAHIRAELQQAAERSINYLPFGLGDRVADEHIHKMEDGRSHALLAVSAATTIDPLVKSLEQIGLSVEVIEPAIVALTRMASVSGCLGEHASMLVCFDDDGIEIGVVCGAKLLFTRRPMTPPATGIDEPHNPVSQDLARELRRISRHHVRVFGAAEEVRHIVLCGDEQLVEPHAQSLRAGDYNLDVLTVDGKAANALSLTESDLAIVGPACAVAIGALTGLVTQGHHAIGPNLTCEPKVERRSLVASLLPTFLWPTLIATMIWGGVHLTQGRLEQKLAKLRIEADHPSPVETTYRELQMQVTQIEQRTARLGELTHAFAKRDPTALLEMIRLCVPHRLWLRHIRVKGERQLRIDGAAFAEDTIYEFRDYLEGAPLFENVTIVTTSKSRDGSTLVTEFSLECGVIPAPAETNIAAAP